MVFSALHLHFSSWDVDVPCQHQRLLNEQAGEVKRESIHLAHEFTLCKSPLPSQLSWYADEIGSYTQRGRRRYIGIFTEVNRVSDVWNR